MGIEHNELTSRITRNIYCYCCYCLNVIQAKLTSKQYWSAVSPAILGVAQCLQRGHLVTIYAVACLQFFAKGCCNSLMFACHFVLWFLLACCFCLYNDCSSNQQQFGCQFGREEFATIYPSARQVVCSFITRFCGKLGATVMFNSFRPSCCCWCP